MGRPRSTGFRRTLVALCAALVATAFCATRHHVQIDFADASTFASPFQHRCGQFMLACMAWAVIEVTFYLRPPQPRYRTATSV